MTTASVRTGSERAALSRPVLSSRWWLGHAAAIVAVGCAATWLSGAPPVRAETLDQRGKPISLTGPAQRAVFLPMPAPSTYIALDETEAHVAGMNPASASAMREGILSRLFPGVGRIATDITRGAGFAPNVESILALRSDAVFQWATIGNEPLDVLDRAGLTVVGIRYGGQSDMEGYVRLMGAVAGKPDRASELLRRQDSRRAEIASLLADMPDRDRPKVLYLGRYTDAIRASGAGTYNDFYIRLAGGRNVALDAPAGAQTVSVEQVLVWDPDVILLGNFDTALPADLYADPRWQGLSAVRSRRVYRLPLGGYRWDPPSQESALTWTWLAELLHPDRVPMNLRADMRGWYRFLYGHDLADGEIDGILFSRENARSARYERFRSR